MKLELAAEKEKVLKAEDDLADTINATINSDEQAQIENLRKEATENKKKLAETQKEL